MDMNDMIFKRKSCRSFTGVPVPQEMLDTIRKAEMRPLYPEIRVDWDILPREQVKCICPWTTPQVIAIYSEEKEGYLENVGFLFQQLDLYLQSIGFGVCWLGMGKLDAKTAPERNDGLTFVIMLAFGHPKGDAVRMDSSAFKRKSLSEISDSADPRLEPARLAPSSVNSQPWYFTHEGETIHTYCIQKGILKSALSEMNQIDIGIALAHMYISNPETFHFFKADKQKNFKGFCYIGSFTV